MVGWSVDQVVLVSGGLAVATCTLAVAPFEKARIRLVAEPSYAPSLPAALVKIFGESEGVYNGLPALLIKVSRSVGQSVD